MDVIMLKKYKYDFILILLVFAIGITLLVFWLTSVKGKVGSYAYVIKDSEEILKIDMKYDGSYEIEGVKTKMIIEVKNGNLKVKESGCPDQICVHHVEVSKVGEEIICLPNKVIIRVGE